MDVEERVDLVSRNAEELVTVDELRRLVEIKEEPRAYIGFEPSGLVHIGWIICAEKIRDLCTAGFDVTILLADWHAYINDKLGGDIDAIRSCGEYMKDALTALGVESEKARFVYATELIDSKEYWEKVLRIGKSATVSRIKRALTIMGRREDEAETDSSKLIYPLMQTADIFALNVDLAYGGMDQRKAHMLARDTAEKLGWRKPIALHTPLLSSLAGSERMDAVEAKMSKSDPDSCIYIHDSPSEIERKVKKAYCPPSVEGNPITDICRTILFQRFNEIVIEREDRFGGNLTIKEYSKLEELYTSGQIHPLDLKVSVAKYLNEILNPVRKYFEEKPENYNVVREMSITR